MSSDEDMERLRKRIADLHAMLGADGAEGENARGPLLALLAKHDKSWSLLTLTIHYGFEQLAALSPDDLTQHAFASLARLLASPDDGNTIIASHDRVATDNAAIQDIKTILEGHGLNWTNLSNLLRASMEQLEDWQPNLLDAIVNVLDDYVTFKRQPHDAVTTALWYLHTYVYDQFMHTPRYAAFSQDPQSGKSVAVIQLGGELTLKPRKYVADSNVAASLYWTIHHDKPTVLLDEAQNAEVAGTLKSIINGGFDKSSGGIPRRQGRGGATISYDVYAPFAFCWNIGSATAPSMRLDTLSRCIVVDFQAGPKKKRYDIHNTEQQQEFAALRDRIMKWVISTPVLDNDPPIPDQLVTHRIKDCWRSLISIADALGRGDIARQAAIAVSRRRMDESIRVRLLRDIRVVFDDLKCESIRPEDLLKGLLELEDCSLENSELWSYWSGENGNRQLHAMKKNDMTRLLRTFGIYTRTVWPEPRTSESKSFSGFRRQWFEKLWEQHCPDNSIVPASRRIKHQHLRAV
jgi:Protein of unknown function (DUF3631)